MVLTLVLQKKISSNLEQAIHARVQKLKIQLKEVRDRHEVKKMEMWKNKIIAMSQVEFWWISLMYSQFKLGKNYSMKFKKLEGRAKIRKSNSK